jgi:hypothetical protein
MKLYHKFYRIESMYREFRELAWMLKFGRNRR